MVVIIHRASNPAPRFRVHPLPLLTPLRIQRSNTESPLMPTRPFRETGSMRSLSSPRSAADNGDPVCSCAPCVEEEVVDQEEGPGADCDGSEDELRGGES